jgi:AcrR family transcriptional regulator
MTALALANDSVPTSTRGAILDAAERRFASRGFDGTSVRDIACEAGLKNQASLYYHFPNKRALYEAVLARGVESIVALVAVTEPLRAARGGTPLAAAGTYMDGVIDYLVEHPHLARLIQNAGHDESGFVRDAVSRLLLPLYAQGLRVLSDAGGPWDEETVPHLAVGLYHMIFGYFANPALMQAVLPDDPAGAAAIDRQRRFLKTAISRLISTGPAGQPKETTT